MSRVVLLLLAVVLTLASSASAQTPRVVTKIERTRAFLGDPVRYTVELRDIDSQEEPTLAGFESFDVRYLGASANSQVVTRFVRGRRVVDQSTGVVHTYQLVPRRGGALVVPAPTVTVDGAEIAGDPIDLFVVAPEDQDHVKLHAVLRRNGVHPLQPVTVELRVFVRRLPPPYDTDDPLAYLDSPPRLSVPWVEPPSGFQATKNVSEWLSPYVSRPGGFQTRVGFTVNDVAFRGGSLFSILDRPQAAVFDLGGRVADATTAAGVPGVEGRPEEFFVYTLSRVFVPLRVGRFEFAPVSVRGSFIVDVKDRRGVTVEVFSRGGALVVEVEDAPQEGRPAAFDDAFGTNFTIRADVEPRRARVGDPLSLTVEIQGRGNVDELRAPDLARSPAFTEAFRVEAPTVERTGNKLAATYALRAASSDVVAVPSIPFAWFDLDRESYGEAATERISIAIEEIEALGAADIVQYGGERAGRDPTRAEGLFGNLTDPRLVRDDAVDPRKVAATPLGLLLAYGALALFVGRRRRLAGDPLRRRRRTAAARATERVRTALGRLAAGDPAAAAEGLAAALRGLAADAAGVPEAGLLARDAARHLRDLGIADETVGRVARVLEETDGLRYGGEAATVTVEAEPLVQELLAALRRSGALS